MSRHRAVKNLDYDELLDEEAASEEISPEQADQLDRAVDEITQILGESFSVKEIKDAAWHYYFDVEKATNYLLSHQASQNHSENVTPRGKGSKGTASKIGMSTPTAAKRSFFGAPATDDTTCDNENLSSSHNTTLMPRSGQADLQEKPKKLSKLQQLALAKAASKKALSSESSIPSQKVISETSKHPQVAQKLDDYDKDKSANISMLPQIMPFTTPTGSAMKVPSTDIDARKMPSSLEASTPSLIEPSQFAATVIGTLERPLEPRENLIADRVFSSLLDGSASQNQKIASSFNTPSPDDTVQKAQNNKKANVPKMSGRNTTTTAIPDPVTKSTGKNRPRIGRSSDSSSNHKSLVVVGHVDAGKSTLFGRLLYDLGEIDERSMQRLRKESESLQKSSFAFAWAFDSGSEERERGVTIDVATFSFMSSGQSFTIIDAPGHKDFVPNMIAGASQADFAVLVIDASRGAFESGFDNAGQTKEHAILIRSLGISRLIVAINKLDNINWSEERFKDISIQLRTYLTHIGFESELVTFIPCSGLSGDNVCKRLSAEIVPWYTQNCLLQEMEAVNAIHRDEKAPLRIFISDVASASNSSNLTISGKVSAGELQVQDSVICMPSKEKAVVKALTTTIPVEAAFAGDDVSIILSEIDPIHVRAGDIICHADGIIEGSRSFEARIVTFQIDRPLLTGTSVVLHRGRADVSAIITEIRAISKKDGDATRSVRHILSGHQAFVKIELPHDSLPLETFSANKDVGRIVLRREGRTVAAGIVTRNTT